MGAAAFVHGLITIQTMKMIKEHRQPPACRVTKSFTPLTRPGKRHTSSIVTCLHFARGIPQRDHKSFGQKAVFLRFFCGRREGRNRQLWRIHGRCSADKRPMCGQNAAELCSFRPIAMGKHEKADFLRTKSGRFRQQTKNDSRQADFLRPKWTEGMRGSQLIPRKRRPVINGSLCATDRQLSHT